QRPPPQGRAHPRLPDLRLDRARRLALPGPRRNRAAADLLRPRARGGRQRRPADGGQRVLPAARARRVAHRDGPLPDRRRRDPDRRRVLAGDRLPVGDRGDLGLADHRARRDPRRRSLLRSGDGGPEARGVLLVAGELLRIATAGSVDDGKSTLIGRLLHDTKSIFEDQMEHVVHTAERRGDGYVNLALLTDGLRAEREQGITIDVAYRYFATPRRKFIVADTPGHEQYTRNMVTGASTADLSIVLVDARKGVSEQTRRHAYIT